MHKCHKARHSGMDCRNPDYMDVFEITIPGTGYPLPGGYDGLLEHLCITMSAGAWERCIMSFNLCICGVCVLSVALTLTNPAEHRRAVSQPSFC